MKYSICKINGLLLVLLMLACITGTFLFGEQQASADENYKNIALGKTVTVSSAYNDAVWNSAFLTDGYRMGSWPLPAGETLGWRTANMGKRDAEVTAVMDLDDICLISKIVLYPRGNGGICFPDDYTLEVSPDGERWITVADVKGDTEVAEKERSFYFDSMTARYVKLTVTKFSEELDGIEYACEVSEWEVWGIASEVVRSNIALHASVQCSSEWLDIEGFWKPEFLTDGDKMGTWPLESGRTLGWRSGSCDSRDTEITVQLDLHEILIAEEIIIYPRGNGGICFPDDYAVQISEDGINWQTVASVTGDTAVEEKGRAFSFPAAATRYVKLIITKLSEEKDGMDRVCELSEIEVWGRNGARMELNKDEIWMLKGSSDRLIPVIKGGDENAEYDYSFVLDGDNILDLQQDGTVKALASGQTNVVITERQTGITKTCRVKVLEKTPDNILITVPVWGNDTVLTEEQFQWLRDADINAVMAVGHEMTQARTDKMLTIAKNIWDDNREWNLGVFIHSYVQGITPASSDDEIKAYAEKYRNMPALLGYHIEDEPFIVNPYARIERILRQYDPSSIADINFLPGMVYSSYDEYYGRLSDYAKLVGKYKSFLSFDNYPFGVSPGSVDENGLFGNFEALRRAGLENDVPTAFYVQGIGSDYFGYRRPDEGVLRYHIASAMAYGFKWIKYFSWYVPGSTGTDEHTYFMDAIMDREGNKTELYDAAAALNKEVHNVGETLVKLDAAEVYHCGSKSTNAVYKKLPETFFAQPVGDCHAIVSLFVNQETGSQYLMIVNKDFTASQTMRFRMHNVASLTELDKGTANGTLAPDFAEGILSRTFLPGEFALYELPSGDYRLKKEAESENQLIGALSTASDSYSDGGWFIKNVHDGSFYSEEGCMGWKTEADDYADNWIMFDLRGKRQMNRLDVYPAGSGVSFGNLFPRAIQMFVSDDGENWTLIMEKLKITQPTTEVPVFRFDTVSARYVKLVFPSVGNLALAELALYFDEGDIPLPPETSYEKPRPVPGLNIALGKAAKASNSYNDAAWNQSFVTDGVVMQSWPTDRTLGWHSGNYSQRDVENLWLRVDLEAIYTINKVVLFPRGNNGMCFPSDYAVQVSLDGVQWTTVWETTGDENKEETERVITFDDTQAKYVRLSVSRLGPEWDVAGYACEISEFEVYYEGTIDEPDNPDIPDIPDNPVTEDASFMGVLFSLLMALFSFAKIIFNRKKKSY